MNVDTNTALAVAGGAPCVSVAAASSPSGVARTSFVSVCLCFVFSLSGSFLLLAFDFSPLPAFCVLLLSLSRTVLLAAIGTARWKAMPE